MSLNCRNPEDLGESLSPRLGKRAIESGGTSRECASLAAPAISEDDEGDILQVHTRYEYDVSVPYRNQSIVRFAITQNAIWAPFKYLRKAEKQWGDPHLC